MRSVVVVLPASMCAMIPMLRVLASWAALLAICLSSLVRVRVRCSGWWPGTPAGRGGWRSQPGWHLPAVVREGLVRLGHLVGVLAALDRGAQTVARVQQLVHQALGHRLLAAGAPGPGRSHHRRGGCGPREPA